MKRRGILLRRRGKRLMLVLDKKIQLFCRGRADGPAAKPPRILQILFLALPRRYENLKFFIREQHDGIPGSRGIIENPYKRYRKSRRPQRPPAFLTESLTDTELRDDRAVTLNIGIFEIVEQIAAVADHLQQAAAGVMVLGMDLQMLRQLVDPGGQDGNLDLRRAGVLVMQTVLLDDFGFFFFSQHVFTSLRSIRRNRRLPY